MEIVPMSRSLVVAVGFLLLTFVGSITAAAETLTLLPSEIVLTGREARQRMLVQAGSDKLISGERTGEATIVSSDDKVAIIESGVVVPVGNGRATITAKFGEQIAKATVVVEQFEQPHSWSFRNHVQSVFSKIGCNTGACHGALAGKGGFKLSLRGYDPDADFRT